MSEPGGGAPTGRRSLLGDARPRAPSHAAARAPGRGSAGPGRLASPGRYRACRGLCRGGRAGQGSSRRRKPHLDYPRWSGLSGRRDSRTVFHHVPPSSRRSVTHVSAQARLGKRCPARSGTEGGDGQGTGALSVIGTDRVPVPGARSGRADGDVVQAAPGGFGQHEGQREAEDGHCGGEQERAAQA